MMKDFFLLVNTQNYHIHVKKKKISKLVIVSSMFARLGIQLSQQENQLYLKICDCYASYFIGNKAEIYNIYTLTPFSKKVKIIVPENYNISLEKLQNQSNVCVQDSVKLLQKTN